MTRGYIIPIGGAESKLSNPAILRRFVEILWCYNRRTATTQPIKNRGRAGENLTVLGATRVLRPKILPRAIP